MYCKFIILILSRNLSKTIKFPSFTGGKKGDCKVWASAYFSERSYLSMPMRRRSAMSSVVTATWNFLE